MAVLSSKGQITIPGKIREKLGIKSGDEIEFVVVEGRIFIRKKVSLKKEEEKFRHFQGKIELPLTSDQLITEVRGEMN